MRVLIIKTSSMGDIIHTFPALTDAGLAVPNVSFDWVVEESFAQIPAWHPLVNRVIPVALRRWRKDFFSKNTWKEWNAFRQALRETTYDLIIDAQGLLKSAFMAFNAKGKKVGFNRVSARESLAALFYQETFSVEKKQHAITRLRNLFAQALHYPVPLTVPEYGLDRSRVNSARSETDLVFLHGTTWPTKHWPESFWSELIKIAVDKGFNIQLPWGNDIEKERANRFAKISSRVFVLPKLDLIEIAKVLATAKAVVAVDTGLLHLTAALGVPAVSLYGPTDPILSGALGAYQTSLKVTFPCAPCLRRTCIYQKVADEIHPPCFATLTPQIVWEALESRLVI
jgi:heptosyltransferase-1